MNLGLKFNLSSIYRPNSTKANENCGFGLILRQKYKICLEIKAFDINSF